MDVVTQMKKFMEPESVALIGVSRQTGGNTFNILGELLKCDYQGKIYPINPNTSEILGVKAYPSMRAVAEEIDLAVVNLPRSLVPGAVEECTAKGIPAIIIVTQGFADASDEEGKQLGKELDELIRKSGVRILGPNSIGTANAFTNFSSSFGGTEMGKFPAGLICQTGFFFGGGYGFRPWGKILDLGNNCDVDFADGLEYFEQDAETKVIALHIEGVRNIKRFLEVARRVTQKKPIVALKTGRSDLAAKAAQSHTGSVVGKAEMWDVALKQSGITSVSDLDELNDMVEVFTLLPLMKGRGIGIATGSGGLGVISIDACKRFGLELANPPTRLVKQISAMSPPWLNVGNPVDFWPSVMVLKQPPYKVIEITLRGLLSDPGVDAALLVWAGVNTLANCAELCKVLEKLIQNYPDKPLIPCVYGCFAEELKNTLRKADKTAAFSIPDRAIRALGHLADYSEFRAVIPPELSWHQQL